MDGTMNWSARAFAAFVAVVLGMFLLFASVASIAAADPAPQANEHATTAGPPAETGQAGSNGVAADHQTNGNAGTSGVVTEPQPLSTADQNGTGANVNPGPYTSTRDGSPSMNGNGDGAAVGQPCAGCVGQADNKNPPGQFPDGSDLNAGYECDTNAGIGRTNPAHTGCATTVTTNGPPPTTNPPNQPTNPPNQPTNPPNVPPTGTPLSTSPSGGPASVGGAQASPVSTGGGTPLAFTGGRVAIPLALGIILVTAGILALAVGRNKRGDQLGDQELTDFVS
jgi:hypothetical protein